MMVMSGGAGGKHWKYTLNVLLFARFTTGTLMTVISGMHKSLRENKVMVSFQAFVPEAISKVTVATHVCENTYN